MMMRTISANMPEVKTNFRHNQGMATDKVTQGTPDKNRLNSIELKLDLILPTLSTEQPEDFLRKLDNKNLMRLH